MIMMDLRSLRFLTSSMAACHGNRLPLLEAEPVTVTAAVRWDLLRVAFAGTRVEKTAGRPPREALKEHNLRWSDKTGACAPQDANRPAVCILRTTLASGTQVQTLLLITTISKMPHHAYCNTLELCCLCIGTGAGPRTRDWV